MKLYNKSKIKNEKGMATVETLPLIVMFVMLIGYMMGLFGIVHTATLSSIATRTYVFETVRNRANYNYFRDANANVEPFHYQKVGFRHHAVDSSSESQFQAVVRPITVGRQPSNEELRLQNQSNRAFHTEGIYQIGTRNSQKNRGVAPAWIMVGYGLCANASCGGSGQ